MNDLAQLVGPSWTRTRTAEALGIDVADVDRWCDAGDLLGLQTADGDFVFPVFQFRRQGDGTVSVEPDLQPVVQQLLDHSQWSVAVLLLTPAPELSGSTPLEWARDGRPAERLVQFAQRIAHEWT